MRILFLGTPDFAVPSLEALAKTKHEIVGVVTQPDRVRGRNNKVTFSPVKESALKLGLKVYQYEKISREGIEDLREINADLMVTCAFGQILSREILALPKYGIINVHASLLPLFRGSSPIQWAILTGEKETGISIMRTAYEVDSGDVLLQKRTDIYEKETAGELFERLSLLGAEALIEGIELIDNGNAVYTPQDHSKKSYYPMLKKEDGIIDFSKTYFELDCFVRGMTPWPSAYTYLSGEIMKVFSVSLVDGADSENDSKNNGKSDVLTRNGIEKSDNSVYGQVVNADTKRGLLVRVRDAIVSLDEIQLSGGKRMKATDYLRGHSIDVGTKLGGDNK